MNATASLPGSALHGVAVVVVTYGAHELVRRHLGSAGLESAGACVVVVDNFFSDAERAAHRALADERGWQFVAIEHNIGFGAAANRGAAHALQGGAEVVVLLNPDAAIDVATLGDLAAAARADARALVAPRIVRPDGRTWSVGSWLQSTTGHVGSLASARPPGRTSVWLTGACLAAGAALWNAIGGFDEDYFLYWEDVDLSVRCEAVGGHLVVRDDLTVLHEVGGSQADAQRGKSLLYYRYNCRNRLVFAAKHLDRRDLVRWLLHTPRQTVAILARAGGRRRLLHSPRIVWAGVSGSLAGAGFALRALVVGRS